ncbi:hypothetical protein GALL_353910 [mine drainage metagenome]|uniref:Uncharacterized protein n=1 Tax=mine drainage metagenome TaxID=410659 RepID=A0A1J5QH19_9ZZZZ
MELFDLSAPHPVADHGGGDQLTAEGREDHPVRDRSHLVTRASDPLQTARDRRRCPDLDHEVDRAHVDPELERRRRDHGREGARLQLVLRAGPLGPAHRPVVGTSEDRQLRIEPDRRRGLRRGVGGSERPRFRKHDAVPLRPHLVHPCGEPFGPTSRVREHEGRAVLGDEVDDALLDVRPDRRLRQVGRSRPAQVRLVRRRRARGHRTGTVASRCWCARQVGEVRDGDDDVDDHTFGGRRLDDRDRAGAVGVGADADEEPGHRLRRSYCRRQADPLRRAAEQRVEPLQGQREVRAPLGPGDGVDLVDDHGVHPGKTSASCRGEDQVQGLGGRDEDVRRCGGETAAFVRRGVTGADPDPDVGQYDAPAQRCLADADEGRPQVALDVRRERLER